MEGHPAPGSCRVARPARLHVSRSLAFATLLCRLSSDCGGPSIRCYWAGIQRLYRVTGCWSPAYERKDWSNLACARREDPCWSAALDSHAVKSNTGPQWRCPPGHASWCQSLRQKAEAPTGRPGDAGHRCVTEPRHPKFTQTCTACLADPRKFADSKTLHAARSRAAGTTGGSHHCGVCAALGFNCSCIAACS